MNPDVAAAAGSRAETGPADGGPPPPTSQTSPAALEWRLAFRYLSSRRGRGFLSLITLIAIGGVAVGVMALIVVIGVMTGLQQDLREKILGSSPHGMVLQAGSRFRMDEWPQVLETVRSVEGVTEAAPFIYTEVLLTAGENYAEGAVFKGVPMDSLGPAIDELREHLVSGGLPGAGRDRPEGTPDETEGPGAVESAERPGILLGRGIAERLGTYEGETLTVVSFQNAELTPTGYMPQMRRFEVTGIFATGLFQFDTKFSYVRLEDAQELLNLEDAATGVEFDVEDPWRADEVAERVETALGGFPFRVDTWQEQNASLFSALKLEKLAMAVILLLIVLVASFNIVSTLVMVVADKTREIGILRAMGLTARSIRRVFMLQGLVIGLVGTLAGGVLGGALAWMLARYEFIQLPADVYFVDTLPVALDPVDVGIIVLASIAISFLATIYPARRAAELQPVEAIRHE